LLLRGVKRASEKKASDEAIALWEKKPGITRSIKRGEKDKGARSQAYGSAKKQHNGLRRKIEKAASIT